MFPWLQDTSTTLTNTWGHVYRQTDKNGQGMRKHRDTNSTMYVVTHGGRPCSVGQQPSQKPGLRESTLKLDKP